MGREVDFRRRGLVGRWSFASSWGACAGRGRRDVRVGWRCASLDGFRDTGLVVWLVSDPDHGRSVGRSAATMD